MPCPLFLLLFLSFYTTVSAFNIDTELPIFKISSDNTYFGYSVALHKLPDNSARLLVGAPRDENGQPGTNMSGAVYACPYNSVHEGRLTDDEWCRKENVEYRAYESEKLLEQPGSKFTSGGKDGQLLGSVISSGSDDTVITCAPLARFDTTASVWGICYLLNQDLTVRLEYQGCRTLPSKERHNSYGACLQGTSAIVEGESGIAATGLPGAKMFTGSIFGATYKDNIPIKRYTMETNSITLPEDLANGLESHSWLGFSVGVGKFGFSQEEDEADSRTIASGAIRANNNTGAVYFMPFTKSGSATTKLIADSSERLLSLPGEKLGSSFGYSLTVLDLNKDGFDDIIVGAPFHYEQTEDSTSGGAIFIYYSSGSFQSDVDNVFLEPIKILGAPHSHFGAAITSLGDINHDDLNDFAVSAPNFIDAKQKRMSGAVYIFHGAKTKEKFDKKPIQEIFPWNLKSRQGTELKSFGFSLSGGKDVDQNGYPDLLVGAYASSAAVLLRTRPIMFLETGIEAVNGEVEKDLNGCGVRLDSDYNTCLQLRTSLTLKADSLGKRFECKLEVLPSQTGVQKRAEFQRGKFEKKWACGTRQTESESHQLFIPKINRDWLNPLKFRFSVSHTPEKSGEQVLPNRPVPDINQFPILDKKASSSELMVEFNKKCGSDKKCRSNLVVLCALDNVPKDGDTYVKQAGNNSVLEVSYEIRNMGELAYRSLLNVSFDAQELEFPELFTLKKSVNLEETGNGFVVVALGNPVPQNEHLKFRLRFPLVRGKSKAVGRPLHFNATAKTSSDETDSGNNECAFDVKVIKEAELSLTGLSTPDTILFGGNVVGESAMQIEEDIGNPVTHEWIIKNAGPNGVSNVTVSIWFPAEVQSPYSRGKWLLYPMEMPLVKLPIPGGKVKTYTCEVDRRYQYINPLDISVNVAFSLNQPPGASVRRVKRRIEEPSESRPEIQEQYRGRQLRISPETEFEAGENIRTVTLSCEKRTAKCFNIKCHFEYLEDKISATIQMRSRLWNSTFVADYADVSKVKIFSNAAIILDPKQGIEEKNRTDNSFSILTVAVPDMPTIKRQMEIPIWIIIVAVFGGLFILFLIIILCWKCGFFKRKRHSDQPLYKAEFHQGEEWAES